MDLLNAWVVKDPESVPEGTTIKKCPCCNCQFAVPNEKLDQVSDFCEMCAPEVAKQLLENEETNREAAEVIEKALGN